jgi:DUF1365 family protein
VEKELEGCLKNISLLLSGEGTRAHSYLVEKELEGCLKISFNGDENWYVTPHMEIIKKHGWRTIRVSQSDIYLDAVGQIQK